MRFRCILPVPLLLAATAAAEEMPAAVDTAAVTIVESMTVTSGRVELPGPDRVQFDTPTLELRDAGSLADLGSLLPSVRTTVNSRGESHFMIRGASERHVRIFLDGIPLNLAWDERVDLETIPITGNGRIEATRGLTTLLDGPGALAGSARLLPPRTEGERYTRVSVSGGTVNSGRTNIQHANTWRSWNLLAATGWHGRDALPLPDDLRRQLDRDQRLNSDLSQFSLLLRAARPVGELGRWTVLAGGWSAEKGVPSELHLGDEARFWRYPVQRRGLVGTSLHLPLAADGRWDLGAVIAADYFEQEIDPRGPGGWDQPFQAGEDYEKDFDRTATTQLRLDHWLGEDDRISALVSARYAHHRESLQVDGPVHAYSQWLVGTVVEAELRLAPPWRLRAGVGWDHAATPEAGDKAPNNPAQEPAVNLRVSRTTRGDGELYLAASRRSRFPSLREQYSGALGRFVPNPALRPERQDQIEIGGLVQGRGWRLEAAGFLQRLSDGIERVSLPGPANQFQRVNRSEIRIPGVEAMVVWSPAVGFDLSLQHTVLAARVRQDGADSPAEDRPQFLSRAALDWRPATGPRALLEAVVVGPRWAADVTDVAGLRRLPAAVVWNLRLGWRLIRGETTLDGHLWVNNLFDQLVEQQIGLPAPGRVVNGGVSLAF